MELGTVASAIIVDADATDEGAANERAMCSRPIDLVHLARYTMGNKALEREILDLFVGQGRVTLDRLEAATNDKDWRDYAHALLGSARAVGAKPLADRVLRAQKLPGAWQDPDRAPVLAAIGVQLDAANRYIRDLFPEE
jgi:HPt (histidine-containing phosphotransfer) domain-containing protein